MQGKRDRKFIVLLCFAKFAFGNIIMRINKEDPCEVNCENAGLTFGEIDYLMNCCFRGCRFFKLIKSDVKIINNTKDGCTNSCEEAYINLYERFACYKGCDFMAKNCNGDTMAICSDSIYTDENSDSNISLFPDIPETDILSDPGLRKELLPGWWHYTGFKLPQTFVKTVPMNSKLIDYGISSDYSLEVEKPISTNNESWTELLECVKRQIKMITESWKECVHRLALLSASIKTGTLQVLFIISTIMMIVSCLRFLCKFKAKDEEFLLELYLIKEVRRRRDQSIV